MLHSERAEPIHVGDTLHARLIRLLTSVWLDHSKTVCGELYFSLCNRDADCMTNELGLGNTAGFLVSRGIFKPPTAINLVTDGKDAGGQMVNPITGQVQVMDKSSPLNEMTDEEKEREAERLLVLFDRLDKTGVMRVIHPSELSSGEKDNKSDKQSNER